MNPLHCPETPNYGYFFDLFLGLIYRLQILGLLGPIEKHLTSFEIQEYSEIDIQIVD